MPRSLAHHAHCTTPGLARSHKNFDGLLGVLVGGWFSNKAVTILGMLAVIVPLIVVLPCAWAIPFAITIVGLLQEAKDWYYFERLLCVGREECVIGSVLHEPELSTDGDRKLDLLLAPYVEPEAFRAMCLHVTANRNLLNAPSTFQDPPFFTGTVPAPPPDCDPDILNDPSATPDQRRAERKKLADYLQAIKGSDPADGDATSNAFNNMLIGWMDRLLDPTNTDRNGQPKNFQGRYYRKDPVIIDPTGDLWNAIPLDYDPNTAWQSSDSSLSPLTYHNPYEVQHQPRGLNPMFRFDSTRLLPYLHCEIDGYRIAVILDELSLVLTSFAIAYTFSCFVLGPWAILIGPAFAFLVWLLHRLFGGGSDGNAEPADVEWDDPDNFGEEGQQLDGDLVALFGPWIMDTEHAQYFEIHPVLGYYVIGRDGTTNQLDAFDSTEELNASGAARLDNSQVDLAAKDAICDFVTDGERDDQPPVIERTAGSLLSHGLVTKWGGGGFTLD